MPTGPGEDILDAIERGDADAGIMSKYKIDAGQLKAFKGLHYGLSNQKMAFDEIEDYYPELKTYFTGQAGHLAPANGTPAINGNAPTPAPKEAPPDIFKLAREKNRLGKELTASQGLSKSANQFGAGNINTSDVDVLNKRKESIAQVDEQIKAAGYDPDDVSKSIGDLPDVKGVDGAAAMKMKAENPVKFDRYKAAVQSQYELLNAVKNKDGAAAANTVLTEYQVAQKAPDYMAQRIATKQAIGLVHKYVDDGDKQKQIIANIVRDKAYGYGVGLPGAEDAITNDPRSQNLNPYQVTALQFLEDTDPSTAESYNRLLSFTPDEVKDLSKNGSFARGYESKSRELENMGMNLMRNSLKEKLSTMVANKDKWQEQDANTFKSLYERYQTLSDDYAKQNERYPAAATMDVDQQMQDAMGTSSKGIVQKTLLGVGENVDDAVNWVGNLIQEPFRSKKESALDDLQLYGDKKLSQLSQHETEGQELFGRSFKTTFTGELKDKIDQIKNNSSLTDEEQREQITKAIIADNRQNVSFVPNDKAGKMNFTAKTVLNAVSNVASEIVPQIALAYFTGGGANASKLKELTSLFGSTFATAYNDFYSEAIEKNKANPSQYAIVQTTIEAASELLNNDVKQAKKILGGGMAGTILENITQEEMSALAKTGRFAAFKTALKNTGKDMLDNAAKETYEELAGQTATNVANKQLFHEDVNLTDDLLTTGVSTFVGMLPLGGLGLGAKYKEATQMQKYALYEAAMNPDKFLAQVNKDIQAGNITQSEGDARTTTIRMAAKAAQNMNAIKSNGTILSDNDKVELLTNEMAKDEAAEKMRNATESQKEKLKSEVEVIDNTIDKLLKPKKNESKTEAKTKAETVDGGLLTEQQPGAEAKVEEPAASGDLNWTNPETGQQFVLRDDKLYSVNKDGQETEFSEKAMQTKATQETIQKIKEANQNATQGKPIGEAPAAASEVTIDTPEDFERELGNIMQNRNTKGYDQMASSVNNKTSDNTFDEYLTKAQTVLKSLFPDIDVKVYDKAEDYYEKERRPRGSQGYYDPSPEGRKIAFNLEEINRNNLQRNVFHEAIHPIVNSAIGDNPDALNNLYSGLEEIKELPGMEDVWSHMNQYFSRGGKIQKVEAVTEFLALAVDGKIDTSKLSESVTTKIIDLINKILEAIGFDKRISTATDLKRLSDSVTKAFQEQDVKTLASTLGNKKGGGISESMDALSGPDQEEAIIKLIKKTPASVTDEKLNEMLVKATGITEAEAQKLIDKARKPPKPPDVNVDINSLSPEEQRASINKINKLFEKKATKKPNWFQRNWESLKNASAWIDNPYRFITKITEDVNREYGLKNKEAIPLGRAFEKSAAGSAALKVQAFVNDVIMGRIGDENLGRLKGEKYQDFQKYLADKRIIDRLDKQEEKQAAGENSKRQTGNVTRLDAAVHLRSLERKYGSLEDFDKRGKALQKHMDLMLKNLVGSGLLSQEQYDQIKADNDFYAPFSVVQSKLFAGQESQPVGISGIVKRIKGIDYVLPKTSGDALTMVNSLGDALKADIISPEEYFHAAHEILQNAYANGLIKEKTLNKHIAALENPGFAINDILDAAANMIYKSEGAALKNRMLQRLYAYKQFDTKGLYIQDVEGFDAKTLPDGSVRMTPKQLAAIKVEPGMAPIKLKVDGKDKIVAVNKHAAVKLTQINNYETATWLKVADAVNKLFRTLVITVSPGFQVANFAIDFVRTMMLSRYGPVAGKGLIQPVVNAALFMPQYIEALMHSALGNTVYKTDTYKQWMESDSFSKGMFDNLFDNEKRIKEVTAPVAKRILMNLLKLKFIEIPGSILEQTHKLATYQRGLSIEGFKPEMFSAMLGSMINRNIKPNMTADELSDAADRLNYEVQNFAGSPNFPQTHQWMKFSSLFLQFFSARVKGEMTDYRRIANLFTGRGEGVKMSKQDVFNLSAQFLGAAGAIAAYAIMNNAGDDDEKEFNTIPPFHQDNYLNIATGKFKFKNEDGSEEEHTDYAKVPLRGITATMNVMANSFVRYWKRSNPAEFKKAALAFMGNASPINLHGKDERELGESAVSNLTPIFKFFIEYSFNRDTHNHRDIIPDNFIPPGMLTKYKLGGIDPWDVKITKGKKTPQWAVDGSKWLYDNLGIHVSAITLDHMENTMGNPTDLYNNALKKRIIRSEMDYPVYKPKIDTEKLKAEIKAEREKEKK